MLILQPQKITEKLPFITNFIGDKIYVGEYIFFVTSTSKPYGLNIGRLVDAEKNTYHHPSNQSNWSHTQPTICSASEKSNWVKRDNGNYEKEILGFFKYTRVLRTEEAIFRLDVSDLSKFSPDQLRIIEELR